MTITYDETGRLLGLAAARDQRTVGDADILAWHADLNTAGVTYPDAEAALTRFYAVEMAALRPEDRRRVTTPDIIGIARKLRSERLANFVYEDDPDETPQQYLARLRKQIADTAAGIRPPAPESTRPLLVGHPRPVAELVEGIGREVPDKDEPVRGPLGVECPRCGSGRRRVCKTPNGRRMEIFHPARIGAANGGPTTDADAEQQEADRRREASRRHLATLPPGAVVEPQDGFKAATADPEGNAS